MNKGGDRSVLREARYWAAETMLRLGRRDSVATYLDLVARENPRDDLGLYATHSLGWVTLEGGDAQRALDIFQGFLRGSVTPALVPTARHGRALALYALKRYPEARDEWTALLNGSLPRTLASEALYWQGDTLGRLGNPAAAAQRIHIFTAAGPQLLIESGLMRLGWWRREAGQPLEAVKSYRGLLTAYPRTREAPWARAGLVRALLDLDDFSAARDEARQLEALDKKGPLVLPTRLLLARHVVEKNLTAEAEALFTDLLGLELEPPTRAYVLALSAESLRQGGQTAEARDRFVAARQGEAGADVRAFAGARLAQMDLEARELEQARTGAERLLAESPTPALRAGAAIIAGEASYGLRQYDRAAELYRRALAEPTEPAVAASARPRARLGGAAPWPARGGARGVGPLRERRRRRSARPRRAAPRRRAGGEREGRGGCADATHPGDRPRRRQRAWAHRAAQPRHPPPPRGGLGGRAARPRRSRRARSPCRPSRAACGSRVVSR
jgi:tetratricopeptide (TPR) repeat protein